MRSIYDYIIETDNRYNNSVDVEGKELVINTEITERDAEFVNRVATLKVKPLRANIPVEVGDDVIVHHNVFRRWYDMRGKEKNGAGFLSESEFAVGEDQLFAYKHNGEWRGTRKFCFVEPIVDESPWREEKYQKLKGILRFGNEYLDSLGIAPGTLVGFRPGSEYEFRIEDKILYRIYSTDITIIYGSEKETRAET